MCLWQRDKVTGNWTLIRCVKSQESQSWKRMYERANPGQVFAVSKSKPRVNRELRQLLRRI